MRKLSFIFASLLLVVTMYAQDLKAIKLSSPDKNRGSSIMKALSDRHSDREYAAKDIRERFVPMPVRWVALVAVVMFR